MQKALFLDRDGVINVDHGYLYKSAEVEFVDGIFDLCQRFQSAGYLLVVVTNQSGIGRGYYTEQDFFELSRWMTDEFASRGIVISKFYFCPHHAIGAKGQYLKDCNCRKPKPGMLLQAAKELDIDLCKSVFIGDKYSDVKAGNSAGIQRCVLLDSHYLVSEDAKEMKADCIAYETAKNLHEIVP